MLRGKWWEIFKNPELNALEEQLNIDNQNIKQAYQNFLVARALIREARAQYFPTITTSPAYSRSASSGTLTGCGAARGATGVATFTGQQSTIYSLPVDVAWAPDLFGKVRNTVREFQYGAQLSAADLENERLIEQASLAQIFFEIRGQDELQRVLNETVEADKKALELATGAVRNRCSTTRCRWFRHKPPWRTCRPRPSMSVSPARSLSTPSLRSSANPRPAFRSRSSR